MSGRRASRYQLDRVILGIAPEGELTAEDRARLASLRSLDEASTAKVVPKWVTALGDKPHPMGRGWRADLGSWSWMLAPTAVLLLLAVMPGEGLRPSQAPATRAKGASRVDLLVQRGGQTFLFDGQALRASDTLVFRYSSAKRHLVLAGREDGGRLSVYASLPLEPGQRRVAETGVRLDDYRGGEWFYALLCQEALSEAEVAGIIDAGGVLHGERFELFRFRVEREAP